MRTKWEHLFGSLIHGLWAVNLAWLFAVAALWAAIALDLHRPLPSDLLPPFNQLFVDTSSQKLMFGIVFGVGTFLSFIVTRTRQVRLESTLWLTLGLPASAASIFVAIKSALHRSHSLPFICLGLFLGTIALIRIFGRRLSAREMKTSVAREDTLIAVNCSHQENKGPSRYSAYIMDIAVLLTMAIILYPASPRALATAFSAECHHLTFYAIGPALGTLGKDLLPGRDYLAQYGIGPGYVTSFLLRDDLCKTLAAFVRFEAILCWGFFVSLYLVVWQWFGSRGWAALISGLLLVGSFHTGFYDCPSTTPLRFTLLFVLVWVGSRLLAPALSNRMTSAGNALLTGCLLGLSLIWSTEVGLLFCVAMFLGFIVFRWQDSAFWRDAVCLALATISTLAIVCLAAFGPSSLSSQFAWAQIEPMLTYGGGFSGVLINWKNPWNLLYAIVIPSVNAASCGMAASIGRATRETPKRRDLAALSLVAFIANGLLVKWANRGTEMVWYVNALPSWLVLAWWLRHAHLMLHDATERAHGSRSHRLLAGFASLVPIAGLALAIGYLIAAQREGPPMNPLIGFRALRSYPSLVESWLHRRSWTGPNRDSVSPNPICSTDIELIQRRTCADDSVAIIASRECDYYLRARRAPKSYVVPSSRIFLRKQVNRTLNGLDVIFVEIDRDRKPVLPKTTFGADVSRLLESEFERVETGVDLACFCRKPKE